MPSHFDNDLWELEFMQDLDVLPGPELLIELQGKDCPLTC